MKVLRTVEVSKSFDNGDVVLEIPSNNFKIGIVSLVCVLEFRVSVKLAEELEDFEGADPHLRSEVGIRAADDEDKVMDDLYRVHMLLKHCFLLLYQVKVLSHEQAHCHSMEAEAVFDIVVGIAHEKPTCLRQLSEATSKVATLLFL